MEIEAVKVSSKIGKMIKKTVLEVVKLVTKRLLTVLSACARCLTSGSSAWNKGCQLKGQEAKFEEGDMCSSNVAILRHCHCHCRGALLCR